MRETGLYAYFSKRTRALAPRCGSGTLLAQVVPARTGRRSLGYSSPFVPSPLRDLIRFLPTKSRGGTQNIAASPRPARNSGDAKKRPADEAAFSCTQIQVFIRWSLAPGSNAAVAHLPGRSAGHSRNTGNAARHPNPGPCRSTARATRGPPCCEQYAPGDPSPEDLALACPSCP